MNIVMPDIPSDIKEKELDKMIENISINIGYNITDIIADNTVEEISDKIDEIEEMEPYKKINDIKFIEDRDKYINDVKSRLVVPEFLSKEFKD